MVDDDDDMRFLMALTLRNAGHDVVEAEHGARALTVLSEHPVDVVVTDHAMPVMDGLALVPRIRSRGDVPPIPVLLVSARAERDDAARALRAGANEFLAKPFSLAVLADRVRHLVDS